VDINSPMARGCKQSKCEADVVMLYLIVKSNIQIQSNIRTNVQNLNQTEIQWILLNSNIILSYYLFYSYIFLRLGICESTIQGPYLVNNNFIKFS